MDRRHLLGLLPAVLAGGLYSAVVARQSAPAVRD